MSLHPNLVANVNAKLSTSRARWRAADNFFSHMPREEWKKYLGYTPPPDAPRPAAVAAPQEAIEQIEPTYPATMDWQNHNGQNFISPPQNQGACGACVAFATAALLEAGQQVSKGIPITQKELTLSQAQLFYGYGAAANRTCATGWWFEGPHGSLSYCQSSGVAPSSFFPYTSGDQPDNIQPGWQDVRTQVSGWRPLSTPAAMKEWISSKGPVVCTILLQEDFIFYQSGVYHFVPEPILAMAVDDQTLYLRESLATGWFRTIAPNELAVLCMAIMADKSILGVGKSDSKLYLRANPSSGWAAAPDQTTKVTCVAIAPDKSILAVRDDGTLIRRTNFQLDWQSAAAPDNSITRMVVMPDGTILGVGAGGQLRLRKDFNSNWTVAPGDAQPILDIAIMGDGSLLAIAPDKTLLTRSDLNAPWAPAPDVGGHVNSIAVGQVQALGEHAVCCVGYDDVQQAWLVKNSWSPNWGSDGFAWIGYGEIGIDDVMYGIDGFTHNSL